MICNLFFFFKVWELSGLGQVSLRCSQTDVLIWIPVLFSLPPTDMGKTRGLRSNGLNTARVESALETDEAPAGHVDFYRLWGLWSCEHVNRNEPLLKDGASFMSCIFAFLAELTLTQSFLCIQPAVTEALNHKVIYFGLILTLIISGYCIKYEITSN